jgi:hypothetical protein
LYISAFRYHNGFFQGKHAANILRRSEKSKRRKFPQMP